MLSLSISSSSNIKYYAKILFLFWSGKLDSTENGLISYVHIECGFELIKLFFFLQNLFWGNVSFALYFTLLWLKIVLKEQPKLESFEFSIFVNRKHLNTKTFKCILQDWVIYFKISHRQSTIIFTLDILLAYFTGFCGFLNNTLDTEMSMGWKKKFYFWHLFCSCPLWWTLSNLL